MKVKELIKELQKLDGEAEIGTGYEDFREEWYDYFICSEIAIFPIDQYKKQMKLRDYEEDKENSDEVDYVIW